MPHGVGHGVLGVKNLSVGICDGTPPTARSSNLFQLAIESNILIRSFFQGKHYHCFSLMNVVVCSHFIPFHRGKSGPVVECLTPERGVADSNLIDITARRWVRPQIK